jgi:hypothetical protein
MTNEPHIIAFTNGSAEEKKQQTSEIVERCKRAFHILSPDGFFTDFNEMIKSLKNNDTVVITDIKAFAKDPNEVAHKLSTLFDELLINVEIVNKEQSEQLRNYQPGHDFVSVDRKLAGLKEVCHNLLKKDNA